MRFQKFYNFFASFDKLPKIVTLQQTKLLLLTTIFMLVGAYYNPLLSPKRLDRFLAYGWFRNCNMLGRQKLICLDKGVYQVINIRVQLENYQYPKRLKKILRQNNQRFRYEVQPLQLTAEKEALYEQHKHRFLGIVLPTLQQSLFGTEENDYLHNPFHTQEICVYDDDKLVAVSFFDLGHRSIASILGLFDHNYQQFSLGIYTMLLEIDLGIRLGKKFYYPGYVLHNEAVFDYKLRLGNLQYHNGETYWRPYTEITNEKWLDKQIIEKVEIISQLFQQQNIQYQVLWNPYFPLAYIFEEEIYFLASPLQIFCVNDRQHQPLVLEYMPDSKIYRLSYVMEAETNEEVEEMKRLLGVYPPNLYSQAIYVYQEIVCQSFVVDEVIERLVVEKLLLSEQETVL